MSQGKASALDPCSFFQVWVPSWAPIPCGHGRAASSSKEEESLAAFSVAPQVIAEDTVILEVVAVALVEALVLVLSVVEVPVVVVLAIVDAVMVSIVPPAGM